MIKNIETDKHLTQYVREGMLLLQSLHRMPAKERDAMLEMSETDDPKAMKLPHPQISIELCKSELAVASHFEPSGYALIRENVRRKTPIVIIEKDVSALDPQKAKYFDSKDGSTNGGALAALLFPFYFKHANGALVTVRPGTIADLVETDLGKNVPSQFFAAPFHAAYFHFDDAYNAMQNSVYNSISGKHKLTGAYVIETSIPYIDKIDDRLMDRLNTLKIDPSKPTRILDIMFIGQPKGNVTNDATYNITLYIQDHKEFTMGEIIERHVNYFMNNSAKNGIAPMPKEVADNFMDNLDFLAKLMLYINCERESGNKFEQKKDRTELDKKIAGLGAKKQAREKRKLLFTYDTILIGKARSEVQEVKQATASEGLKQQRKTHWRRGHFRNQRFGEGLSKVRIIKIDAALINKSALVDNVPVKKYEA